MAKCDPVQRGPRGARGRLRRRRSEYHHHDHHDHRAGRDLCRGGRSLPFLRHDAEPEWVQPAHDGGRHPGHTAGTGRGAPQPFLRQRGGDSGAELEPPGRKPGGAGQHQAGDDRLHVESEGRLVGRRPDHGQGLRLCLDAAAGRPGVRPDHRRKHGRVPRHPFDTGQQRRPDRHRDLPHAVCRLGDALLRSACRRTSWRRRGGTPPARR